MRGFVVLHEAKVVHTDLDVKQWVVIDGVAYLQVSLVCFSLVFCFVFSLFLRHGAFFIGFQ